jgi:hypothetical protein
VGEGQKDIKNRTLWVLIEERDNIKNIQLAVFGAAIGFMIGYIANDFIIRHLFQLRFEHILSVVLFFALTLFLYISLGYVCHMGDINHIFANIQFISNLKRNANNELVYYKVLHYLVTGFVSLLFGCFVLVIFVVTSFMLFEFTVIPLDVLDDNAVKKNHVFMFLVGTIYATWFATSYWINIEFPDPMDELPPPGESEN